MLKITRVDALDSAMLDVELSNGCLILFAMSSLLTQPAFSALLEDDRILYPKTDGRQIYWQNGPSIPLERLMQLVQTP